MSHPFIPVANTASVELIYSLAGEVNENIFHVQKSTPYSLTDLQALRGVFDSWDSVTNNALRSGSATLIRIRSKALDSNASAMEDYYLPTPRAGTNTAGNVMPLNVCIAVKLATGVAGRSNRGRVYLGNLQSGLLADAGHITSGFGTTIIAAYNTLISNLATAGHTLVVTSLRNNGAWRITGHNTPVTGPVLTDLSLDSQRRRLPGRGHAI